MAKRVKPTGIKIAFWNAEGLQDARDEAEVFVDDHNIDVLLVCETHLKACQNPKIRNYSLYRADRDARGGGTAIYIRSNIDHYEVDTPALQHVEANTIIINTTFGKLRISAVYKSPSKPMIDADLVALLSSGQPTIIAGDLNAKHPSWNSRITNSSGRQLRAFADHYNIAVHGPQEPTFYHRAGHRPDVLDILVAKDVTASIDLFTVVANSSDHNPVVPIVNDAPNNSQEIQCARTCWPKFHDILESTISCAPRISNIEELEEAVDLYTTTATKAMNDTTKFFTKPVGHNEVPEHIKDLIRNKNQARRAWQRQGDTSQKTRMNQLCRLIRNALRDHRNERWAMKLSALEAEDYSIWKTTKILRKSKCKVPPLHGNNGLVFSNKEKAEAFADRLELQCSPNFKNCDLDDIDNIERQVRKSLRLPDDSIPQFVSPAELCDIIAKLKEKKAPGPDNIPNKALKSLGRRGIMALVNIFNASLRLKHFPKQWKEADVVMLPKPGQNLSIPSSYRPISLLSTTGKLLEKVLLNRLQVWVNDENILPDHQHGFRVHHSTLHQLLRVTEYITDGFNKHQSTGAIFLDVAKAFDKVWHEGLIFKLIELKAPRYLIRLMRSFLTNRSFRVKFADEKSEKKVITAGTPQGSLLSPLLFAIYAHDIPEHPGTMLAQYADDTAVMSRSTQPRLITKRLQDAAHKLEDWFQKWRIGVNASKSAAVYFTRRRKKPDRNINMFEEDIPWQATAKYLGLILDSRLSWKHNTDQFINKAKASVSNIYSMLNRKSELSTSNKLLLYRAVVRPVLTYAAPIWGYAGAQTVKRIQVQQNKILRMVTDAPWFVRNSKLHEDLNVTTIEEVIKEMAIKFFSDVETHANRSIREASTGYSAVDKLKYNRPKMILST